MPCYGSVPKAYYLFLLTAYRISIMVAWPVKLLEALARNDSPDFSVDREEQRQRGWREEHDVVGFHRVRHRSARNAT